jgi:hypothetical protein
VAAAVLGATLAVAPPASAATIRLAADAYVSEATPTTAFGGQPVLRVRGAPVFRSYLRFDVSKVSSSVRAARLVLQVQSTSGASVVVRDAASSTWSERSITWSNAPALGGVATAPVAVTQPGTLVLDVTPLVRGNGAVTLVLTSADASLLEMASKEQKGGTPPRLEIDDGPPPDAEPPAAPTGLGATAGDGVVSLDWADNAEPDLAGYRVYRRVSGGLWSAVPQATVSVSGFVDGSVTNGTTYDYRVTALDATGNEGAPSAQVSATPRATEPPPLPFRCAPLSEYSTLVRSTASATAYWRLGETSGTSACDSVGSSTGTYRSGTTLGAPGAIVGDPDTAVALNGSSGHLTVASSAALNPSAALTLEAWIRPESVAGNQTVLRKDGQYLVRVLAGGSVFVRLWWTRTSYTEMVSPAVVAPGIDQHLAVTYDGARIRVFRDGAEAASLAADRAVASSTSTLLIGQSGGYDWFRGVLDEVAIYAAALTPLDVATHHRVGARVPFAGPATLDARGGPGSVGLRWPADGSGLVASYRVYRAAADGTWPASPIATLGAPASLFVDLGVANGAAQRYRVTAVATDGTESAPSPEASATPRDDVVLAAGDIAGCDTFGDETTAALLDARDGIVAPLGDLAYQSGTLAELESCYGPSWGRHGWRTRPAVGDHEYLTPGAAGYWAYWGAVAGEAGKGWYSYDAAGWHVVVLNSTCPGPHGCGPGSEQLQWLEADLAASTAECTLATFHHPLFTSSSIHTGALQVEPLWRALHGAGAEVVLNGNDHAYERFAPQAPDGTADPARGIREFVVGTGGRSLYAPGPTRPNSEARINGVYGVLALTLQPGGYAWEFVPEAGQTATDSGSAPCH